MCTSYVLALDDVDVAEICISLDTCHGCACVESSSPHVRFHTCEIVCGR